MAGQKKKDKILPNGLKQFRSDSHCFSFPRITVVTFNAEAQHDAVAQGISVLVVILETPRGKSRKLRSTLCRPLDGESWYTHISSGSGSRGAGAVTFHKVSCASGFSKSIQGTAAASVWLLPEYREPPMNVPL